MLPARTISISIDRPWTEVYEAIWRPGCFPTWASGLGSAEMTREGDVWRAEQPEGTVRIRFTDRNDFGVMDHSVDIGGGRIVEVPMRVLPNQSGAEVMLTLYRQPEMSDEKFAQDAEWIARDLAALRDLVTGSGGGRGA